MFKPLVYFKEIAKTRFQCITYLKEVNRLKKSDWFDAVFYRENYQDVRDTGINPYFHYLFFGRYESRAASKDYYQDFSADRYHYKPKKLNWVKKASTQLGTTLFFSVLVVIPEDASIEDVIRTVTSVQKQGYPHFEILVGFDKGPHLVAVVKAQKIKTLADCQGLKPLLDMAEGDYVAVVGCGERLTNDALFEAAKLVEEQPDVCLVYADEDAVTPKNKYHNPHFKTDYNYQLLLSYPYMGSFVVFNRVFLKKLERPFDAAYKKAEIYDACLKVAEKTDQIRHIPKVLNHRAQAESRIKAAYRLSRPEDAVFQQAVNDHLARIGQKAKAGKGEIPGTCRIDYAPLANQKVSIIIPFKDHPALLQTCVHNILSQTKYSNYEIILVSNNSREDETFALLDNLKNRDVRIKTCEYNKPFNFSAINNFAATEAAAGDCFLFLNNDTEVITKGWLKTMLGFAVQKRTGAVSAKLLYANGTVQSAGIGISGSGEILEYHKFFKAENLGYFGRLALAQDIGAVSGACLMVEKEKFFAVGGFDEKGFPVTYNDIDLCYRLRKKGYVSVLVPYVVFYHYESTTRAQVFDRNASPEYRELKKRYGAQIEKGDPYYSPNFKQKGENFEII